MGIRFCFISALLCGVFSSCTTIVEPQPPQHAQTPVKPAPQQTGFQQPTEWHYVYEGLSPHNGAGFQQPTSYSYNYTPTPKPAPAPVSKPTSYTYEYSKPATPKNAGFQKPSTYRYAYSETPKAPESSGFQQPSNYNYQYAQSERKSLPPAENPSYRYAYSKPVTPKAQRGSNAPKLSKLQPQQLDNPGNKYGTEQIDKHEQKKKSLGWLGWLWGKAEEQVATSAVGGGITNRIPGGAVQGVVKKKIVEIPGKVAAEQLLKPADERIGR